MYAYAANNPVKYTDPDGREVWDETYTTCTITSNDKLWKITEKFNIEHKTNITYYDVAKANGISDPNIIFEGDKLDFSSFLSNADITPSIQSINISSSKDNLSLFESVVNTVGTIAFFAGGFASTVSDFSKFSKNLYALSDKLGYLSLGINIYQFVNNPNLQNSRDMAVTSIGLKEPILGIFLSSYFSYQDAVNKMIDTSSMVILDSDFIYSSNKRLGGSW